MNDVNRLRMLSTGVSLRVTSRLRHCRRLLERYRGHWPLLLVNSRRGQPGNRQLKSGLAERALRIIHERYTDFVSTLACVYRPVH